MRMLFVALALLGAAAGARAEDAVPPLVGELQPLGRADQWMMACGWRHAGSDPLRDATLAAAARAFPDLHNAGRVFDLAALAAMQDEPGGWGPFCDAALNAVTTEIAQLHAKGLEIDRAPLPSQASLTTARTLGRAAGVADRCGMPQAQVFAVRDGALEYNRVPGVSDALLAGAFFAAWNDQRTAVSGPAAPLCRSARDGLAIARRILDILAKMRAATGSAAP